MYIIHHLNAVFNSPNCQSTHFAFTACGFASCTKKKVTFVAIPEPPTRLSLRTDHCAIKNCVHLNGSSNKIFQQF